jgi:hypothetical protein
MAAMHAAIAAGYRGSPDPRCRLAEILLRAGRTEPAHDFYAQVKAATPDDVWLYNNAGLEYDAAGDHSRALDWLTAGLELALDTGDPDNLVSQLNQLRREQLTALGHELDDLDARAETFLAQPRPRRPGWSPTELPAVLDALNAASGSPLAPTALVPPTTGSPTNTHPRVALAVSWFPAEEFATALRTWPQLAQDWGTTDHTDYNHQLQRHLHNLSATTPGATWIAPIHLDTFQRWCQRTRLTGPGDLTAAPPGPAGSEPGRELPAEFGEELRTIDELARPLVTGRTSLLAAAGRTSAQVINRARTVPLAPRPLQPPTAPGAKPPTSCLGPRPHCHLADAQQYDAATVIV